MNDNELMNALYEGRVLMCSFDPNEDLQESVSATMRAKISSRINDDDIRISRKLYGYKCNIEGINIGDLVLVETSQGYYRSVVVVEIKDESVLEPSIKYKWVVSKVDTSNYEQTLAQQKQVLSRIRQMKKINARTQLLAALGIADDNTLMITGAKK